MRLVGGGSLISGDFGESLVAFLLAKEGIDVVRASTIGFDLFAIDHGGRILKKDTMVGISVKMRVSQGASRYEPTIPIGSDKIEEAKRIWKLDAWLAIVVGSVGRNLKCYLLPFEERQQFSGRARRQDVVAPSELRKDRTGDVKHLGNW